MSKHTPGPWSWYIQHGELVVERQYDGEVVALVQSENEDDLRLIAAAPELLEAAKITEEAAEHSMSCDACESYFSGLRDQCPKMLDLTKRGIVIRQAAISKAEGR